MEQNDFLIKLNKKKFYNKFYHGMKKSPFVVGMELYEDEYRLTFSKPTKVYHNILNYCIENNLIYQIIQYKIPGDYDRFKISIKFN